jgi:hypothetical protein
VQLLLTILDWLNDILAIVGARLGWVEYFYPEIADKWERYIDDLQDRFEAWGDSFTRSHFFETLLTFSVPTLIFILSIPVINNSPVLDPLVVPWWIWSLIYLVLIPTAGGLILYFLSWLIEVLNRATDGHALGTIGLTLTIFGLSSSLLDKLLSFIFGY